MIFSQHCDEGAVLPKINARRNSMKMQRGAQTRTCDFFVIARKNKKVVQSRVFPIVFGGVFVSQEVSTSTTHFACGVAA